MASVVIRARAQNLAGAALWRALAGSAFALGAVVGALSHGSDVSWLITCAERMLAGQRLYIDILEVNPPLSTMLYAPGVLLGRLAGVPPELAVVGVVLAAAACSLWLSGAILAPVIGPDPVRRWKLAAAGAFVLAVLPAATFAEREHFATIGLLPFVALCVARAERKPPPPVLLVLAGAAMGLAVCIKPHFAACAALPAVWAAWSARDLRFWTRLELWTAAAVVAAYAAVVLLAFPQYLHGYFDLVRYAYLLGRIPLWDLLVLNAGGPIAVLTVIVAARAGLPARWLAAPAWAAVGGAIAYITQSKGWAYQAYPMLAFACLGLFGAHIMEPGAGGRPGRLRRELLVLPPALAVLWFASGTSYGALRPAVQAVASAPRMLSLSPNLGVGFPLVREVGGTWVGSEPSLWISSNALFQEEQGRVSPEQRRRLEALMEFERRRVARDIRVGRPDVILVDPRAVIWAAEDPELAAALSRYRPVATVEKVEIWAPAGGGPKT